MVYALERRQQRTQVFLYAALNLAAIYLVHQLSDLPVLLENWESKATLLSQLKAPTENFYPPGSAILLTPFLWIKPNYEYVIYFYFVISSILYFLICSKVITSSRIRVVTLAAFTFNPYLLWTCNSGQDTVFELFLLLSFAAILLRKKPGLSLFPLYLLCLVRPAYWTLLILFPIVYNLSQRRKENNHRNYVLALVPFAALGMTLGINLGLFGKINLAGESGVTALFSHNKFYYLSMPKFDMDYFLAEGGNMEPEKILQESKKFKSVEDIELRAALVSIVDNPKSVVMNTMQKLDSYFLATQKTPQLSGFYYLNVDQDAIIIKEPRLRWSLILGNLFYFLYRSVLLLLGIAAVTLFISFLRPNRVVLPMNLGFFLLPYVAGAIPGILFYTESRFKVVSELLLVPLIISVLEHYKRAIRGMRLEI